MQRYNNSNKKRKNNKNSSADPVIRSMLTHNIKYGQEPLSRRVNPSDSIVVMKFNCNPLIATLSSGAYAGQFSITAAAVNNFGTRIASLFREYCLIHAHFRIWPNVNATQPGVWQVWASETDVATPSSTAALNNNVIAISNVVNPDRVSTISWELAAGAEANWTLSSTTSTSYLSIKVFANVGNFGFNGSDNSSTLYIEPILTFAFRGMST